MSLGYLRRHDVLSSKLISLHVSRLTFNIKQYREPSQGVTAHTFTEDPLSMLV